MELLLSAISTGGLVGAANQYMCLLLVSIGAKVNLVTLTPQMAFMESWWFIGIVGAFWLLTIAPAYSSALSPGVMNVINTLTNFASGFAVPVSAALLALASVGIIAEMNPELYDILRSLQLFNAQGGIGATGLIVAGGSAVTASVLTGSKFLAKPAVSTATGTTGTVAAPMYATIENVASLVLMALVYVFTRINPWLLVALLAVVAVLILGALAYALYQLWKLGRGVGRVFQLVEKNPKTGLSIIAEFVAWGSGWMLQGDWTRGIVRLLLWAVWLLVALFVIPAAIAALSALLVAAPPLALLASALAIGIEGVIIVLGLSFGIRSAGELMKTLDKQPVDSKPGPARGQLAAAGK